MLQTAIIRYLHAAYSQHKSAYRREQMGNAVDFRTQTPTAPVRNPARLWPNTDKSTDNFPYISHYQGIWPRQVRSRPPQPPLITGPCMGALICVSCRVVRQKLHGLETSTVQRFETSPAQLATLNWARATGPSYPALSVNKASIFGRNARVMLPVRGRYNQSPDCSAVRATGSHDPDHG